MSDHDPASEGEWSEQRDPLDLMDDIYGEDSNSIGSEDLENGLNEEFYADAFSDFSYSNNDPLPDYFVPGTIFYGGLNLMNFGQYSNLTYHEVWKDHQGYCRWALKQSDPSNNLLRFVEWLEYVGHQSKILHAIGRRDDATIKRFLSTDELFLGRLFCYSLRDVRRNSEGEDQEFNLLPLWQTSNTLWNELILQFGREKTASFFENISHFEILYCAIGNVSIEHFQFIFNSITINDDTLLISLILNAAIKKASERRAGFQWKHYYKPLLDVILVKLCSTNNPHMVTNEGRHFLHVSIDLGLPWDGGLQRIIDAALVINKKLKTIGSMQPFDTVDEGNGLVPFLSAACSSSNSDLSSCYKLLRSEPSVLNHLTTEKSPTYPSDSKSPGSNCSSQKKKRKINS